jgi:LytS/YehU family sensor histidine kinase
MLYEVRTEKIPIADELSTIEKYIQLQKIRTAHPESIQYTVEGESGQWMIEPMLFLPFVENAFKHGEKKADIRIHFRLAADSIRFDCQNQYQRKAAGATGPAGGLGDSLIRKRLMLLYPNRHVLEVEAGADTYKTTLILSAHAN